MSNTTNILSRLSLAPAGSFVVYDAGHGYCLTVHLDELHEAHVADIAVGAHPYGAITLSHSLDFEATHYGPGSALLPEHLTADRDGISIVDVLADWMDWCDDVMESAQQRMDGEDEVPSHEAIIDAMRNTWRVPEASAALLAELLSEVNAAA